MAVIINGINELPKCCADCFCEYDNICCNALAKIDGTGAFCTDEHPFFDEYKERLPNCPMTEKLNTIN